MQEANEVNIETQPDILQSKFGGDVSKLAQSYANLERELSRRSQGLPTDTSEESTEPSTTPDGTDSPSKESEAPKEPTEGTEVTYGEAITSAVSSAGLDMSALQTEFESEEGLSEASRTALDKAFGKSVVDAYMRGLSVEQSEQSAVADEAAQKVLAVAGGEESWNTIQSWAAGPNGRADLVDAFNSAIDSGNSTVMAVTAEALRAAYENTNGTLQSSSIKQGSTPAPGGSQQAFKSNAEMTTAMKDPRYATDPAYRDEIMNRIKATKFS